MTDSTIEASLRRPGVVIFFLILFYVLAVVFTQPYSRSDTLIYAADILLHESGQSKEGFDPLWEFGHVLWRPLGFFLYKLEDGHFTKYLVNRPLLQVSAILISISVFLSGVGFIFSYFVGLRISASRQGAVLSAILFLCCHAVLNYTQSGSAYVPGLSLQMLGLFMLTVRPQRRSLRYAGVFLAGVFWALAICLWLPYVITLPSLLWIAYFCQDQFSPSKSPRENKQHVPFLVICAALGGVISVSYIIAMYFNNINSPAEVMAWAKASSHGIVGTSRALRLVTGITRGFLSFGGDLAVLKNFVLRDPYAKVTLWDALASIIWKTTALWKIAGTFTFLAVVCWYLRRSELGRRLLISFAFALSGTILLALIFEASEPERYLPCYAILIAAVAVVWSIAPKPGRWMISMFVAMMAVVNLNALSSANIRNQFGYGVARAQLIQQKVRAGSRIIVLHSDDARAAERALPFHEINKGPVIRWIVVLFPNTSVAPIWRESLRREAAEAWNDNADLWLSRRLLVDRPKSAWWVEADDPRISWKDLSRFFGKLTLGSSFGGDDGFVLILPTEENRLLFDQLRTEAALGGSVN